MGLFFTYGNSQILDNAHVLSDNFKTKLLKLFKKTPKNHKIFVITLNSLKNSPSLHEINRYMGKSEDKIVAFILYPKARKIFIIRDIRLRDKFDDDMLNEINTYHLIPYFASDDFEGGIESAIIKTIDELGEKKASEMDEFLSFLVVLISYIFAILVLIAIVMNFIIAKRTKEGKSITSRVFILTFYVIKGVFIGGFFSIIFFIPFKLISHFLFLKFPNITLLYMEKYSFISVIIVFFVFLILNIKSGFYLKELKYKPNKNSRGFSGSSSSSSYSSSSSSSSYSSSYSSSSSYSGGGGSFGGGGASGSW